MTEVEAKVEDSASKGGDRKSRTSFSKSTQRIASLANANRNLSRLGVRKTSYGFSSVPGIKPIERVSQLGIEYKRPPLVYLPTYQVEPPKPFHYSKTMAVVNDTLDDFFTDFKYSADAPVAALQIAGEVMRNVKSLNFKRYRIIAVVTIGQKRAQSYNNAAGFLWDGRRDGYVETHRETSSAFIQVTVFCVYLD